MDPLYAPKPRVDSLYPSIRSSGTTVRSAVRQSQAATKVFPIPGKEVLRFWMPPDPRHRRHYSSTLSAIQAHLHAAVAPFLPDGQVPSDKLVFQPMMIGKNEQDAKLHMAVLCEPSLATILEEAFTHPTVQTYLGIPNSNECLGYTVIPEPHEEVNAQLAIDVFSQTRYDTIHNTYCGAPLLLKHRNTIEATDCIRQATFGGIIKVIYAHGEICFYGMTAGHVTNAVRQHRHQLSVSSPTDTDLSKDPFSMGAWLSNDDSLGSPLDPETLPGVKAQRTKLSHDWCIFKSGSPRRNRVVQLREYESLPGVGDSSEERDHPILIAERPSFNDDASDPVLVLGAAAGTRRGILSGLPASIFMASCQAFVSVYVLQMSGDHKVVKGDSGAWIPTSYRLMMHSKTSESVWVPFLSHCQPRLICLLVQLLDFCPHSRPTMTSPNSWIFRNHMGYCTEPKDGVLRSQSIDQSVIGLFWKSPRHSTQTEVSSRLFFLQ
ncbi:hypothetical protein C7974DRAFT_95376 [Boeremia exigua]|uniref:uncharacterized protein n=1 Tax=Boeremia exigua TaxID=749465 RepID=UPI001E8DD108|nr:uncharacterized protein C7974DRAFT_95376 [Boeremia exigua]KAH6642105.1 hypothetical protein C7974DRAFT_95376 [Boeremia exigua]